MSPTPIVVPAQAGTHREAREMFPRWHRLLAAVTRGLSLADPWVPAFAGMTNEHDPWVPAFAGTTIEAPAFAGMK
jgi:hypothetical protein